MNALALVAFLSVAVPSDQQVVDEINLLRTDPRRYASFLEARLQLYRGNVLRLPGQVPLDTKEGKVAVQEAIRMLRQTVSVPALRPASGLSRAARDHVKDIGPKGLVQHKGSDKVIQRIVFAGTPRVKRRSAKLSASDRTRLAMLSLTC